MIRLINPYACFALAVFVLGLAYKAWRLAWIAGLRGTGCHRAKSILDAPTRSSFRQAWLAALAGPSRHFHLKTNRLWTCGYALYHAAIILVVAGYMLSALVLAGKIFSGVLVPDVATGEPSWQSLSTANLLAVIFGNGESLQAGWLFGPWAGVFQTIGWGEIGCAILGQACLLSSLLFQRMGGVRRDLDPPARHFRLPGTFSWQHLGVRVLIAAIIGMEVLGRLQTTPDSVYYHSFLGLTLLLILPFSYVVHILFVPPAVYFAFRNRRSGIIA